MYADFVKKVSALVESSSQELQSDIKTKIFVKEQKVQSFYKLEKYESNFIRDSKKISDSLHSSLDELQKKIYFSPLNTANMTATTDERNATKLAFLELIEEIHGKMAELQEQAEAEKVALKSKMEKHKANMLEYCYDYIQEIVGEFEQNLARHAAANDALEAQVHEAAEQPEPGEAHHVDHEVAADAVLVGIAPEEAAL